LTIIRNDDQRTSGTSPEYVAALPDKSCAVGLGWTSTFLIFFKQKYRLFEQAMQSDGRKFVHGQCERVHMLCSKWRPSHEHMLSLTSLVNSRVDNIPSKLHHT